MATWAVGFVNAQHLANCTTKAHAVDSFAQSWAYDAVADDEFDDDELLELAQAGRSQEEGPPSHHATDKSPPDTAPPQNAKAAVLDSNSGQVGSIAEPLNSQLQMNSSLQGCLLPKIITSSLMMMSYWSWPVQAWTHGRVMHKLLQVT